MSPQPTSFSGGTVLEPINLVGSGRMNTTLASEVLIQKASPDSISVLSVGICRKQTYMGGIYHE